MKANRKFRGADEAVSPVIAVILMVAITVVLAATVYVWVSGFGSNSSAPAKSIAFSSGGALVMGAEIDSAGGVTDNDDSYKLYVVSAASPGLKYSDLVFSLDGASAAFSIAADADRCDVAQLGGHIADDGATPVWLACTGTFNAASTAANSRETTDIVTAGDHVYIMLEGGSTASTSAMSGKTLRVLDSAANSIITSLTIS